MAGGYLYFKKMLPKPPALFLQCQLLQIPGPVPKNKRVLPFKGAQIFEFQGSVDIWGSLVYCNKVF